MKKYLILGSVILVVAIAFTIWFRPLLIAAPTVGTTAASPTTIAVNTPTAVTITAVITDPTVIPTGINLLRINANGSSTILGQLRDDGTNGDAVAGDKTFTARVTFNESNTGQIKLQVSTAFRGVLKRVISNILTVNVWSTISDPERFTLSIPTGWSQKLYQDTYTISSTTTLPILEGDPGNEIQINKLPLNGFADIQSWLKDYFVGEVNFSTQTITYYINPTGVRFAIMNGLPGLSSDNIHAFTIVNDKVIEICVSPASTYSEIFLSMLSAFRMN